LGLLSIEKPITKCRYGSQNALDLIYHTLLQARYNRAGFTGWYEKLMETAIYLIRQLVVEGIDSHRHVPRLAGTSVQVPEHDQAFLQDWFCLQNLVS
jgi:hypothetical protein